MVHKPIKLSFALLLYTILFFTSHSLVLGQNSAESPLEWGAGLSASYLFTQSFGPPADPCTDCVVELSNLSFSPQSGKGLGAFFTVQSRLFGGRIQIGLEDHRYGRSFDQKIYRPDGAFSDISYYRSYKDQYLTVHPELLLLTGSQKLLRGYLSTGLKWYHGVKRWVEEGTSGLVYPSNQPSFFVSNNLSYGAQGPRFLALSTGGGVQLQTKVVGIELKGNLFWKILGRSDPSPLQRFHGQVQVAVMYGLRHWNRG